MGDKGEMLSSGVEGVGEERVEKEMAPRREGSPCKLMEAPENLGMFSFYSLRNFFVLICICIFQMNAMHSTLI